MVYATIYGGYKGSTRWYIVRLHGPSDNDLFALSMKKQPSPAGLCLGATAVYDGVWENIILR